MKPSTRNRRLSVSAEHLAYQDIPEPQLITVAYGTNDWNSLPHILKFRPMSELLSAIA